MSQSHVLVQVAADAEAGREIGWSTANVAEQLDRRLSDIRNAVTDGAAAIAQSLPTLPEAKGWQLQEVGATFGVTLTAEAGALITKASAGATFEVTVSFRRISEPQADGPPTPS